ncbi:MAG: hypothetical protein ACYCPS_00910 [Candidatus Saccharimonadales bacterium]
MPPIPIEVPSVDCWKQVEIKETFGDPLVPLGVFSPEFSDIYTNSIYAGEGTDPLYRNANALEGAFKTVFTR